ALAVGAAAARRRSDGGAVGVAGAAVGLADAAAVGRGTSRTGPGRGRDGRGEIARLAGSRARRLAAAAVDARETVAVAVGLARLTAEGLHAAHATGQPEARAALQPADGVGRTVVRKDGDVGRERRQRGGIVDGRDLYRVRHHGHVRVAVVP